MKVSLTMKLEHVTVMLTLLLVLINYSVTTTEATVLLDKSSYYPGQTMIVTITRNDSTTFPIKDEEIEIVVGLANKTDLTEWEDEINIWHDIVWNTTSKTMVFNITFLQYLKGDYKVGLLKRKGCCKRILLTVSDKILINPPVLSINLPKKEYYQGESVQFNIYNPYINLTYKVEDVSSFPPNYDKQYFEIVPTYTSIYSKRIDMITSQLSKYVVVPYDTDEYKIILVREYFAFSQVVGALISTRYVADVANSTFTVKRNYPILVPIEQKVINATCSNITALISLTTRSNILLRGPFTVDIISEGGEFGMVTDATKRMRAVSYPRRFLNTTIKFNSRFISRHRVRIVLDYKVWALSDEFFAGCVS